MISCAQLKTVGCAMKTNYNNKVKITLANTFITRYILADECSIHPYILACAPPSLECPPFCIDDDDDG